MSADDELVVDYDAISEAARRVRALMATVSDQRHVVPDVAATGHVRLADAIRQFSEGWNSQIEDAHDEGDRLECALTDALTEYRSTDSSVAGAADSLGSHGLVPR